MNSGIEDTVKTARHTLDSNGHSQTVIPYEIPSKAWTVIGANILVINKSNFLCVAGYHSSPMSQKKNYQQND